MVYLDGERSEPLSATIRVSELETDDDQTVCDVTSAFIRHGGFAE